jgi:oxygen-independent coproporphyrinogen-3 oxidase
VPGIYLSYPFCAQKCTFCNFASGVHGAETERRYVDALIAQIRATPLPFSPDTLYLGGGTPSSLSPANLDRIFAALPHPFREVTIEAAPGTLTPGLVQHWRSLNINRVSLGVQSFVTAELRRTGRRHTAETVQQDVTLLRQHGIPNFNIDLIAGLPGQTAASWGESLAWIERLGPPHVSVYMFEIDQDSSLGAEVLFNGKRYGAPDLPSEDLTATLYETAAAALESFNIRRYEISNFAQPGAESLHNLKYWQLAPYLGFGADAHSYNGTRRWQNPESVEAYLACLSPALTEPADPSEHFWVGLRLMNGIQPSPEEWQTHQTPISLLVHQGLLEQSGPMLRLTPRGIMLSNEVFERFLPA